MITYIWQNNLKWHTARNEETKNQGSENGNIIDKQIPKCDL